MDYPEPVDTCWYSCLGGTSITILSLAQLKQFAQQAGFTGVNADIAAAIAMAESGGNTLIRGRSDSRDRGVLQINSFWHPEVSDQCAFDPACAFRAAFNISGGSNFSQWTTFQNGAFKQFMSSPSVGTRASVSCQAWLQGICDWIKNPNMGCNQQWVRSCPGAPDIAEGGVDLAAPAGTPVFALGSGPIVGLGLNNLDKKGVLSQRVNVPGHGLNDIYYQHVDLVPGLHVGQNIMKGQLIGHVTDSSAMGWFQHTEIGFNAGWGGPWNGGNHPAGTQWVSDPRPWIASLMGAGGTGTSSSSSSSSGSGSNVTVNVNSGPTSATQCPIWDIPCALSEAIHTDAFQRISIVGIGIILALVGIIVLFIGEGAKVAKTIK